MTIINQTKCSAAECEQMSGQLASVVSIADSLVTEQDNLAASIQDVQLSSCSKGCFANNKRYRESSFIHYIIEYLSRQTRARSL